MGLGRSGQILYRAEWYLSGAGVKLIHTGSYNDVMPGVEVGYAFFVSKQVTIEPAVYYDQSFKNHSDYSTVGVKVGIGIYL